MASASRATSTPRSVGIALGVDALLASAPAASPPLFAVPAFAELTALARTELGVAARLRFVHASSAAPSSGAAAQLTWTAGSLDLCPLVWSHRRFRVDACSRAEGGTLAATGVGTQPVRSSVRPWLTAGLAARARWIVVAPVFLEAEAALAAPLVRDRFFVEPDDVVYRAPAVAASGAVGAGVVVW